MNMSAILYMDMDIFIHVHTKPLRLTHLPTAPSPPSVCICWSRRPSPAARTRSGPSSRRRRLSAARTCGRHPRRGRRRLPGEPEATRQYAHTRARARAHARTHARTHAHIVKFSCAIHMHVLSKAT